MVKECGNCFAACFLKKIFQVSALQLSHLCYLVLSGSLIDNVKKMSRIRRKTFVRVLAATVAIYICIRMFRYLSNETAPITMRYPKAILPNEEDTRELRTAIVECKFSIMYEDRPSKCNDTPLILLLVVSSPNNILHRFMLRKYLAPVPNLPFYSEGIAWRIVFVISRTNNRFLETKIKKEIAANGDIILGR